MLQGPQRPRGGQGWTQAWGVDRTNTRFLGLQPVPSRPCPLGSQGVACPLLTAAGEELTATPSRDLGRELMALC